MVLRPSAWAEEPLSLTAFHIIQKESTYAKLRAEVVAAIPDCTKPLSLHTVEKLPFLNACTREGTRLSYGVTARNPQLWPKALQYEGWTIFSRTPMSCTIVDHNRNEKIFPDSWTFLPDRWLDPSMKQWFFTLGKGSRSWLGVNLAMAEMHMCLSTLFRRYRFELLGTDESDRKLAHDFFLANPKLDSKGVRVNVQETELLLG
ncbi:hypothetical protein LTS08_006855 [Lithohypha guttulata]|nr:hypothetical protein LTS08_006855 [Lithohypha guttulata]